MEEIKLNSKQAYTFASSIFADIQKYVEEHEKEFREFLKGENVSDETEE